ncbi:predicted protein [Aspergillus terreus NIH2624]|uniref:Uncharacterized protein n=1 Tax=Aspergillus terreus (strain NIH 2624 / FGSC A1156) TaxID=341663 RepID=Q0CAR9_ASPTN|nr:uncharacterized protein ATEG_09215 [Aspergillus terreus NIH2624]EAU30352.1 predicted protein [Aspergillus terreus NIH2624]
MAFKSSARAAGHRLQSLWRSLRQQVPISIRIHIYRRGSAEYNGVSKNAVSTPMDTDHLRDSHTQTHRLVVTNPDPAPAFVHEPAEPAPEPRRMSPSTVQLAHLLMDTDYLTPQHEEQLRLILQAGYAAQDARPMRYSPSDELFFDV